MNDRIKKLKDKMRHVPFGNSDFQNRHFTNGQESPERRFRHCLLQINQKVQALEACSFRRRRIEIDIAEINYKIKHEESDTYATARLEIDKEEKECALEAEEKLIEDAMIEIETYENILDGLPDNITRKIFEEAELGYWKKRLLDVAQIEVTSTGTVSVGTMTSLKNIGMQVGRNEEKKIVYKEIKKINN